MRVDRVRREGKESALNIQSGPRRTVPEPPFPLSTPSDGHLTHTRDQISDQIKPLDKTRHPTHSIAKRPTPARTEYATMPLYPPPAHQSLSTSPSITLEKGITRLRAPSSATRAPPPPQPRFGSSSPIAPSSPRYGAGPAGGWPLGRMRPRGKDGRRRWWLGRILLLSSVGVVLGTVVWWLRLGG